jgi:hypothetical protein
MRLEKSSIQSSSSKDHVALRCNIQDLVQSSIDCRVGCLIQKYKSSSTSEPCRMFSVTLSGVLLPSTKNSLPPCYLVGQCHLPDLADRFYFHQRATMDVRVYNLSSQSRVNSISLSYCIGVRVLFSSRCRPPSLIDEYSVPRYLTNDCQRTPYPCNVLNIRGELHWGWP